jgi:GNAT superfamily N-acetyltransferase
LKPPCRFARGHDLARDSVRVEEASAAHAPALEALFERAGSPCFCRYWHFSGNKNEWLDRCAHRPEENAAELDAALAGGAPEGLVAIDHGDVLGWMKLTPRLRVPKLRNLPVYRSLELGDDETTFAIGCFLVDPQHRKIGVARALVRAAPAIARTRGASALEAYPRRSTEKLHDEEAWQGPEHLFVESGFRVVHDVGPYPVYRMDLATRL